MPRLGTGAMVGILIGALGILLSFSPWGRALEEHYGLKLLFHLRGKVEPPSEVIVVSLDSASAKALNLPEQPWKWPRSFHARLVHRLAAEGALAIGFDLVFEDPRHDGQDVLLAKAMESAGNVVLCEFMRKESLHLEDAEGNRLGGASVERLVKPTPLLAEAALACAPFPLPKVPIQVSRFWTFKTSAGDIPTLPVVMLQVYGLQVYEPWMALLESVAPHSLSGLPKTLDEVLAGKAVHTLTARLRTLFLREPQTAQSLMARFAGGVGGGRLSDSGQIRLLESLARMYAHSDDNLYLNYYGPPGTIVTIPYHRVVKEVDGEARGHPAVDFRGKAVFVGLSELNHPQQMDAFHTVYSQADGVDICGVEIAATAFGNLLQGSWLRPAGPLSHSLLIMFWGLFAGLLCWGLPAPAAVPGAAILGVFHVAAAWVAFSHHALWIPVLVPVFLQIPLALVSSISWKYRESNRERRNVERALEHYLPRQFVEMVSKNLDLAGDSRAVYGVCLFSDISGFTAFSEGLDPAELRDLLNRYYHRVFEPVGRYRGTVSDLVGDSMLALWAGSTSDPRMRMNACEAALDMLRVVVEFNRESTPVNLSLRMGIHAGELVLGTLGARGHYEYRPVGDVVNTASRIEELNKHLKTRILATGDVVKGLEGLLSRELGEFVLLGKKRAVSVFEVVGLKGSENAFPEGFLDAFSEGLAHFRAAFWTKALERFQQCRRMIPDDGPSRFYAELCQGFLVQQPEAPWRGWVYMTSK